LVLCSDPAQRPEVEALIAAHQKSAWECHTLTVDERGATVEALPALADWTQLALRNSHRLLRSLSLFAER